MSQNSCQLIVTADDFGRSATVNAAIIRAHREGCLTHASLMVAGEAWEAAVALARKNPSLGVGLHLVCIDGTATLPPSEIHDLVDVHGVFPSNPLVIGTKYFFSERAREQLGRELRAQFDRFAATGLSLSHVDSHWHFHMHPKVFPMVVALCHAFSAPRLRIPRDDFWANIRRTRRRLPWKSITALEFAWLNRHATRFLTTLTQGVSHHSQLITPHRCHGLFGTGAMDESAFIAALASAESGLTEIYAHPDTARTGASPNGPEELRALLSEAAMRLIQRSPAPPHG